MFYSFSDIKECKSLLVALDELINNVKLMKKNEYTELFEYHQKRAMAWSKKVHNLLKKQ